MLKNYHNLKKLEAFVNFGFFTSLGGISKGDYYSLNCNSKSEDKKINIKTNIKLALKKLGIERNRIKLINQIHSKKIFQINNINYKKKISGDGLITMEKKLALGVLTADCAPIFIFDIQKTIICCLHAGWQGTLSNIVNESILKLENKNIKKDNIIAIVGPCLGFKNYEVNKNFKMKFLKKNRSYSKFFKSKNNKKDLFNLRGILNYQLGKSGISEIYNINKDTYIKTNNFFSYRRSTHQKKIKSGRMINIISLRD